MTLDEFWSHVADTKAADPDAHAAVLTARLAALDPADIIDFAHWWDVFHAEAYTRDLWAAAYYVNGGCSDDGFIDFRSWLILQGRDTYHAVVADPNALADLVADGTADGEFMCECYIAAEAWDRDPVRRAEGSVGFEALYARRHPDPVRVPELAPAWDFDDPDQRRVRLPRFAGGD